MVAASAQHSSRHARVTRPGSGLRNLIAALGLCLSLPALAQHAPVSIQRGTPQMAGQSSRPIALDKFPGQIREVVFQSTAATLITSDSNGVSDIFIKTDNPTDPHILVSQNLTVPGNGASTEPDATPDGSLVVFTTQATNLLPGDANAVADIALRILGAPSDPPERISVAHDGAQANGPSGRAAISANGLVVAFVSSASNLVPGDTNNGSDVFVRDRSAGTTTRVSIRSDGSEAADSGTAVRVDVSADGRFVVFSSAAANLVLGDANGVNDIFVHDRFFGTTQRVSLNTVDGDPNGASLNPVISADGRFVAFESGASNLVFSDSNGVSDVFVRVLPAARTERVSVSSSSVQSNGASAEPSISADGRFIAFASTATNLGEGADTNGRKDVFLRDRISGSTRSRVQGNGDSGEPSVSGDGRTFAFTTAATDLGTSDGNGTSDVWRALGRPDVSGSLGAATPPVPRTASRFTVEASVAAAGGFGPTPRGAVEIRAILGGSVAARCISRELEPSGTGRCELSVDLPGAYVLELGFLGDPDYAAVPLLATAGLTVGAPAPTDLRIAVQAPEPSLANRSVFVQADLLPRGGRPGGIINFSSPAGSCVAELPLSGCLLPFGASDGLINATYSGDGTFAADAASPLNHTVGTSIWRRVLETNQGSGRGPGGNAGPGPGALSDDGRWFVFSTDQPHLVPEDRGDQEDVFLLDQRLGLIRRISKAANGDAANSDSVQPTISGDGRWVAFTTYASNVLPGDSNGQGDVVIVDVQNDTSAELVSVSSSGGYSAGTAFQPRLNHDGSLVAFHSRAADLVAGDSNSQIDVFVRDRRTNTTTRVSVGNGGSQGNGGLVGALTLDLSPDGRYLLFQSDFTNLVPGDSNGQFDVFRHDRQTNQTLRASIASDGSQSGDSSAEGRLSPDGDFAVFNTRASLIGEDVNGLNDVYLHEFSTRSTRLLSRGPYGLISSGTGARSPVITGNGEVFFISDALEYGSGGHTQVVLVSSDGTFQELVSRDPGGLPGNADSRSVAVSRDGQWVSFATLASTLDPNAPLGGYMLVPAKGVPRAVQRAPVGRQPNGPSFGATLSTSGRHAVLVSAANNLGPEDKNSFEDVYWLDLDTGDVRLLSKDPLRLDAANASSLGRTGIAADGLRVAFTSSASNLVVGDSNAARDVFLANVGNGTLQRVSLSDSGGQAQSDSDLVNLSTDGMTVLFRSTDAALGAGAARGAPILGSPQLYLRDIADASTVLLSVNVGGTGVINAQVLEADGPDNSGCRAIYISTATDVVAGVSDGRRHLYLRDRCMNTTTVLDAVGATIGNGDVFEAVLARGGRFVAFQSNAGNLVDGITGTQLYLRNLDTNKITLIGVDQSGFPLGAGLRGGLSIDDSGRYVAFTVGIAKSTRGPGSSEVLIRDTLAGQTATASDAAFFAGEPALSGDGVRIAFTSNDDSLAVGDRNGLDDVLVRANPLLGEVYLVGDVSVSEGNSGVTSVNVDITLSGASSFPVTVNVRTADGTATTPGDYQPYTAPLTFTANGTQTINTGVVGDRTLEPDETFQLIVETTGGSPVTLATGTVTIQNDDTGPNICTRQGAGPWVDSIRWSCAPISGTFPGPGDTAIFDTADDAATLTEPADVATLDLRAGLIDGNNALTVTSQFLWSGGTLEAPDSFIPITLPAGSTATLDGGAKTLRRRQLVNQGTLTWTAGQLTLAGADTELRNDAQFIVDVATGSLRLASDGAIGQFFHHTFGSDRNVIKRGAGRYAMDADIEFRNGNSVLVEAGTASFSGPGSSDPGPYQVDNGGILEFNLRSGQQRSIAGPVTGGGSLLKVGQGDVLLQGAFGAEGAAVSDGRLLFFQGSLVNATHLLVSGTGTLGGSANLQAQRLTWSGGTISGSAGGTLRLLGTGINASVLQGVGKCLDARQLTFAGEADWTAGDLCLRNAARVAVDAGAQLRVTPAAPTGLKNDDASAVQLLVQGTLRKQGMVFDSDVPTTVNGTLDVASGALTQRAGMDGTGSASIAASARLQFAPTGTINAALPLSGNGEVVTLTGTTRLQRPITGNTLSLLVQGTSIAQVDAPLALRGLGVSGGALQLFQTVGSAGASSYSGGTIQIFSGNLDLAGPTAINAAGADRLISCESGCSGGTLRLLAGADLLVSGTSSARLTGGLPLIQDDPAARLAVGPGATLELSGADQLRRGTLVVDGMLSRATGALGVGNGTGLSLSGIGVLRAAGINLNAIIAPGGTGTIGTLTLDGPTSITGGQLRMELASAANFDRIVMAGTSTLALNPAAQLQPGGPYTPASTDVFPLIQHASGARSGTLTLTGGATGFVLEYPATRVEYRQPTGPRVCRFNSTGGIWEDPANWNCTPAGGFPGAADTAIFDTVDDAATLTGPVTVATLDLRAGLIGGGNALTVTSQFLWSGGTLEAPDNFTPLTLPTGSTATLDGGTKTLRRRQLVNQGTLTWTAGQLTLAGTGTELRNDAQFIVNVATGSLRLASDGASGQFFHHTFGTGRNVFKRGAGRYEMDADIEFRNGNSVRVEAGTASFTGPGSSDPGPYQVDNGGILEFNLRVGQSRSIAGPVTGGGSLLKLGQGDVQLTGAFGAEGASVQDGRLLFFQSGSVALTHLLVGGNGTLGGSANLQAQRLTWEGGTISGATGGTLQLLGSGANASALLGAGKCLDTRQLILAGEARWTAGKLCLRNAARIEVGAGASLEVEPSVTELLENNDASAVQLLVQGIFRKQGAVLDSNVPTTVNGSLVIAAGTLTQRAALTGTGSASIAAGARVQFAPTASIDAALPFTGNGEIVTLSGTTRLLRPITGNTLSLNVQGSGTAQVEAPLALRAFAVSGGSLQLLQTVSSAAPSSYSGGTIRIFGGNLDIASALTINVASADRLISCESGCSGSALRLLAGADVGINGGFKAALTGGLPLILDDPAARLAIGAGAGLELSGADQLRRGTLVVDGMLSRATGALGLGNGTALALSGTGTLRAASGITLNALVQPGGIGSIGQLTLDGPTTISGGSLRMDLASAASFDRLVMAGTSTLALNPAAQLQPSGPYTPASTDVFPLIQHASGARSGTLTLTGGATGFVLEYPATRVEYRQPTGPRVCRFNVTSGVWDNESNWACTPAGGFPGAIDTAIVDNGGDVEQNGARTVTGLQLVSGTIGSSADPLIVTGSFSWTGGQFLGSSSTSDFVRVESTATSVTLGGGQKGLSERELRLDADATWTTGLIELGANGQLLIFPGRTLTTTPNATPLEFVYGTDVGASVNNQGRILKTGPGRSGIESSVLYEGAGTLEVAAAGGEFFLHAPSSFIAGEMKVAAGGRLVFANSDQNFTSTARLIGAGELQFGRASTPVQTEGSVSLHRVPAAAFSLSPGANVVIFDANLRIEAPGGVAFSRLTLDHPLAHLAGDAALSVTQTLLWRAGRISGGAPGLGFGVASTATATLSSPAIRNLAARTLDVAGTLAIEGGTLALDATAQLQIQPGALLRFSGTVSTTLSSAASPGGFPLQNNGRIERQVGGTTRLLAGLQQDGEVVVNAGATLEVGEFATGPASRFVVNGTLRNAAGLLAFGGGSVEGTGTLQATVVDNIAAEFRPGGVAAGTLTVNGQYRQQSDARLSLDLLGTGCTGADRLVASGTATLAGALTLNPGGGCTPTPPQEFLLLDASTLTGTFGTVNGTPTNYIVDYAAASGDVRLRADRRVTTTQITSVSPQPTPVGQPYTVTVSVAPGTTPVPTGTVVVSAAAPFASESCTITLPATSCTMPAAALPGARSLVASYTGDVLNLPSSSAATTHPVRTTPTITALGQTPASTVVGEPFTVRARVVNPLSTLTPTGELQVRPLPLGEMVSCTLVETVPGTAEATCAGVISPIAAAKLIDIRYLGSENQVFAAANASSVQEVTPASTTLAFVSAPNPSSPGGAVQVDFTLSAALPSLSPLSAISGLLSVTDGVASCTATLPATRCTLTLNTVGVRQLRARYQGDANFNPSAEVIREHLVAAGGAELIVRKRNLQRTLIGGAATVYVVEVENRGPLAVTARVRDPIPTGLSNFRWTCTAQNGAQCAASGTGALDENVLMPVGSLARFVLTADAQRDPEVIVVQEARVDPPTGIDDPNPANNVARDVDPIGLFGDGFEAEELE